MAMAMPTVPSGCKTARYMSSAGARPNDTMSESESSSMPNLLEALSTRANLPSSQIAQSRTEQEGDRALELPVRRRHHPEKTERDVAPASPRSE